jgi:HK97 gp10 family phage protein
MPIRYRLETKGFSEYLERLVQAGKDVDVVADEALAAGGDVLLDGMLRRVPRKTGNLANHLERTEPERDGNFHSVMVGLSRTADSNTARYGGAQEFGTSSMPAHPYIRPAIDEDMRSARAAMKAIFENFLGGKL